MSERGEYLEWVFVALCNGLKHSLKLLVSNLHHVQ